MDRRGPSLALGHCGHLLSCHLTPTPPPIMHLCRLSTEYNADAMPTRTVVSDRDAPAQAHRQRDQELLEHAPQEAAGQDGHRPRHAQAALRRARRRGRRRRRGRGRRAARQGRGAPQPHGAVGERAAGGRGAPGARGQAARARRLHLFLGAVPVGGPRRRARPRLADVHAQLRGQRGARVGAGGAQRRGRRARRHAAHAGVRGGLQGPELGRRRRRRRGLRRGGGLHRAASRRLAEPEPEAGGEARRGRGGRRSARDGGGEELLEQYTEPGQLVCVSGGARRRGVLAGARVLSGGDLRTWFACMHPTLPGTRHSK
ncbi:hypothetical protein ACQJBY_016427 [Aegilops geniculata]